MAHTDPPVMSYTQGVRFIRTPWVSRFTYRWGWAPSREASIRLSEFHIRFGVGFYNFRDQNFVYPRIRKGRRGFVKRAAGDVVLAHS